jgi:hypothetical protein
MSVAVRRRPWMFVERCSRESHTGPMPRRPMAKRATGMDGATTVRGKRANGAGSVYFDQANECYLATWRDSEGKRRKVRG